jgi:hypothetical protein
MKLPNLEHAVIPREKIIDYLLSATHRDGRHKAAFFAAFGFSRDDWQKLADAIKKHAADHEVARSEESPYGIRHIVEGKINSPDGRDPLVRVVWFIEAGAERPRLATAYPLKGTIHA